MVSDGLSMDIYMLLLFSSKSWIEMMVEAKFNQFSSHLSVFDLRLPDWLHFLAFLDLASM